MNTLVCIIASHLYRQASCSSPTGGRAGVGSGVRGARHTASVGGRAGGAALDGRGHHWENRSTTDKSSCVMFWLEKICFSLLRYVCPQVSWLLFLASSGFSFRWITTILSAPPIRSHWTLSTLAHPYFVQIRYANTVSNIVILYTPVVTSATTFFRLLPVT